MSELQRWHLYFKDEQGGEGPALHRKDDFGDWYNVAQIDYEMQRLRSEIALRDRCIRWLQDCGAFMPTSEPAIYFQRNGTLYQLIVPAEFAAILSGKADSEVAK